MRNSVIEAMFTRTANTLNGDKAVARTFLIRFFALLAAVCAIIASFAPIEGISLGSRRRETVSLETALWIGLGCFAILAAACWLTSADDNR